MKKRILFLVLVTASLISLLFLSSCQKEFLLSTPKDLTVDENNLLTWSAVDSARVYTVNVKSATGEEVLNKTSRLTYYSLSELSEGDYTIRIMAKGGAANEKISDWSQELFFHRDYESGCTFELINGNTEYSVKSGKAASGEVIIEATYRGKPVTAVSDNAFKGNRTITSVILGENIRSIGNSAFYNCGQLVSISMPDSISQIGTSAFQGCRSLTTISIPKSLSVIPEYCFAYCRQLSNIVIGDNITTISPYAFQGSALVNVTIPNSVHTIGERAFANIEALESVNVGTGVTTLPNETFYEAINLKNFTFAENSTVSSLGERCFASCKALESIVLPDSLIEIQQSCFYNCVALSSVNLPDNIAHIGKFAFNASKIYADAPGNFVYVGNWLVSVKDLSKLDATLTPDKFNDGVVGIADYSFSNAVNLISATIPNSVKIIGQDSFSYCPNLAEFKAGTSLKTIDNYAFRLSGLYKLFLNNGLENIKNYAFYGCSMLDNNERNPIIPETIKRIGVKAFMDTKLWNTPKEADGGIIYAGNWAVGYVSDANLGAAKLRDTVVGISDYAFSQCQTLKSLGNLSRCTNIGEGAFYNCTALETVVLHPRITRIPDFAFYKCEKLYRVDFPISLESIGRSAFYKCTTLKNLFLTERDTETGEWVEKTPYLTSIDRYAFYGCTNLTIVLFNNELASIGPHAFSHCTAMKDITLPEKLTVVSEYAFAFCGTMWEVKFGSSVTTIEPCAFYKCAWLQHVEIPDSVVSIGNSAFYKCEQLNKLILGNSVKEIGDFAFYNVKSLESLSLPQSLESIGKYAFKSLENVSSIIIPASIRVMGPNAFYGAKITTFYVEDGAVTRDWSLLWNSSHRPVVFNAQLSENKDYVVSITIADNSLENGTSISETIFPIAAPSRKDYVFAGWKKPDSTLIDAPAIKNEANGTVLVADWRQEK